MKKIIEEHKLRKSNLNVIEHIELLKPNEVKILKQYVIMQYIRTPNFRNYFISLLSEIMIPDRRLRTIFKNNYLSNRSATKNAHLYSILKLFPVLFNALKSRKICIGVVNTNTTKYLLTSDDPVVIHENGDIYLPVNSELFIQMGDGVEKDNSFKLFCDTNDITDLNRRQFFKARRYVVSAFPMVLLELYF